MHNASPLHLAVFTDLFRVLLPIMTFMQAGVLVVIIG
jgi:hypothetical protein